MTGLWIPGEDEEPEDVMRGPADVWYVERKGAKATSLEKFNVMCAYGSRKGGILMPPPWKLTWGYWQSPWVETRLAVTLEERERERFTRATGITIHDRAPLAELCNHDFVYEQHDVERGPDGPGYSRYYCRTCGVYARIALP